MEETCHRSVLTWQVPGRSGSWAGTPAYCRIYLSVFSYLQDVGQFAEDRGLIYIFHHNSHCGWIFEWTQVEKARFNVRIGGFHFEGVHFLLFKVQEPEVREEEMTYLKQSRHRKSRHEPFLMQTTDKWMWSYCFETLLHSIMLGKDMGVQMPPILMKLWAKSRYTRLESLWWAERAPRNRENLKRPLL